MLDRSKLVGMAVGLWLGFVWVVWGFGDALLVALGGVVGYLIVLAATGELRAWVKAVGDARK